MGRRKLLVVALSGVVAVLAGAIWLRDVQQLRQGMWLRDNWAWAFAEPPRDVRASYFDYHRGLAVATYALPEGSDSAAGALAKQRARLASDDWQTCLCSDVLVACALVRGPAPDEPRRRVVLDVVAWSDPRRAGVIHVAVHRSRYASEREVVGPRFWRWVRRKAGPARFRCAVPLTARPPAIELPLR